MPTMAFKRDSVEVQRMLAGDWPAKRNIIVSVEAGSVEGGRALLRQLRSSLPY